MIDNKFLRKFSNLDDFKIDYKDIKNFKEDFF